MPYFIADYNSVAETATIWVKVPNIPASSTKTVYIYYGNSSPAAFDIPPVGPFQKYDTNPVIPVTSCRGILPENIVYDEDTEKYWLIFEYRRPNSGTGAAYSVDLVNWTEYGQISTLGGAPHVLSYNNTWYLFYGRDAATSSAVTGPYQDPCTILPSPDPGMWPWGGGIGEP